VGKINLDQINTEHFDVLKELGNIGAGNATTALSRMLNLRIDMKVPNIAVLEFKEVADILGGAEKLVVGILLGIEDDISGMMLFILDEGSASSIIKTLLGGYGFSGNIYDLGEMELSALQEIGNIIAGAYLNSLAQLTNLKITPTVPHMSIDMAGAILSVPAIEFGKVGDKVLLIQTEFGEDDENAIFGYFVLVPTLESYDTIFGAIGM